MIVFKPSFDSFYTLLPTFFQLLSMQVIAFITLADVYFSFVKHLLRGEREEGRGKRINLKGKKVLITAGPTYEKIDPVRFIGNYSSGKMGFALAEECAQRGAEVTLVAGPVSLKCSEAIHRIDVESCEEMYQAATEAFKSSDAAILCAAVADFRPETQAKEKIKRESQGEAPSKKRGSSGDPEDKGMTLRLVPNPDIAAALGKMKTEKQVLVGFALETNDEEVNAKKKLEKKNLDFIVLNSLQNKGTCFQSDENQISIISKEGQRDYEKKSKQEVARDIVEELERRKKEEGRGKKEEVRWKMEDGRSKREEG